MKIIDCQFCKCPARCKVLYEEDNGETVCGFVYGNAICNTCPEVALKQFAEMCKRGKEE